MRASAIAAMRASMVLAAAFRSRALSLAKNCSMGLKRFDGFANAGDLVAGEIVHDDDIAVPQDRDHELLDIGAKARPIHRSVEHTRRGDLPDTQRGDECRGLPVPPRHAGHQALTARAAAIAARHVGRCAGLVDENQALRVQLALARTPIITRLGHIWPVLLGSSLRLFLSGSSRNLSLLHRHPMLTLTLRSASSQACSSLSVISGSAATRARRAASCGASFGFGPPPDRRAVTSPIMRRRIKAL